MKKLNFKRVVLAGAMLVLALGGTSVARSQAVGCYVEPPSVKPVLTPGCRDMSHQCVCDSMGNCYWAWVCVR